MHFKADELAHFIDFVEKNYHFKLSWYNTQSTERRLAKLLKKLELANLQELELKLSKNLFSFDQFVNDLTVNVTQAFREPKSLLELKQSVLPFFRNQEKINILIVGCSTGEELGSLCILLKENKLLETSTIWATDLDSQVLEKAQKPQINRDDWEAAKLNYLTAGGFRDLDHYFIGAGRNNFLEMHLLEKVHFQVFDLCSDDLKQEFDLILCKNVLIYFQYHEQHHLLNNLARHLKPYGFLALGEKESMTHNEKLEFQFAIVSAEHNIYRKQ